MHETGFRSRSPWLTAVLRYIDSCLGEPLSIPALAAHANISPSHLAHAFPKLMGCTVGEYIRIARIRAAAAALRESDLPIQEIAYRTGFYDQAHFCRAFKAAHGVTPGDYRSGGQTGFLSFTCHETVTSAMPEQSDPSECHL